MKTLGLGFSLFLICVFLFAQTTDDRKYTGCLTNGGSIINVAIGEQPAKPCSVNQIEIAWNETGPKGEDGPPGPQGEPGSCGVPIIWSGHCVTVPPGDPTSAIYCTDQVDIDTAQDYLSVGTDGIFTVLIGGYYRIDAFAWQYAKAEWTAIELLINDSKFWSLLDDRAYSSTQISGIVAFEAGDVFYFKYHAKDDNQYPGGSKVWFPPNAMTGSRSNNWSIQYLGPKPD